MQQHMGTNSTWNWSVVVLDSFFFLSFLFYLDALKYKPEFLSLLQLLEISFNCLEEVESNIPVSPLHLAVSIIPYC